MKQLYALVTELSVPAAWAILAVVLARLLLRKAPANLRFGLWLVAAMALLCPVRLKSPVSLVPELPEVSQVLSQPVLSPEEPVFAGAVPAVPSPAPVQDPGFSLSFYQIWLLGLGFMVLAALISYLRLMRRVRVSVSYGGNVRLCDRIPAPFILGIFRPKIYLPSELPKERIPHVLAHERSHLRRRDPALKMLALLGLEAWPE